jgi:hypothetical protein
MPSHFTMPSQSAGEPSEPKTKEEASASSPPPSDILTRLPKFCLLGQLYDRKLLSSYAIANAMCSVDRRHFSPGSSLDDVPELVRGLPTPVICSRPAIQALVLREIQPKLHERARVLHLGCGVGNLTFMVAMLSSIITDMESGGSRTTSSVGKCRRRRK